MGISGSVLNTLIEFRNPKEDEPMALGNVLIAEVGFIALIPFALVEMAIMNIARIFTCFLCGETSYQINAWASKSVRALFTGLAALLTNLFLRTLSLIPMANENFGANAIRVSEVFARMSERLPNPTPEQRMALKDVTIPNFIGVSAYTVEYKLQAGNEEWQDRTIRMLWAIFEKIPQIQSADEVEVIRELVHQAFSNCSNRMSTEVERVYYKYIERDLMDLYENALTAEECLVYELTQYRMDIRDLVINTECPNEHNASSHNYFRRKLNANVFYLPPAPLSGEDVHYESFAMQDRQEAVIVSFNRLYSPEGIFSFVEGLLTDTGKNKIYKFKPAMFVEWLEKTNRMNEDAFEDESMMKYKREIIRTFLEEHNFLRPGGLEDLSPAEGLVTPRAPRLRPAVNQNLNPESPLILPRGANITPDLPVITGMTFEEKYRSLFESEYTTDELKRYRDAFAIGDDVRSIYNHAIEWREISDIAVEPSVPTAPPAAAPVQPLAGRQYIPGALALNLQRTYRPWDAFDVEAFRDRCYESSLERYR